MCNIFNVWPSDKLLDLTFTTIDFVHDFEEDGMRHATRCLLDMGLDQIVRFLFVQAVCVWNAKVFVQLFDALHRLDIYTSTELKCVNLIC